MKLADAFSKIITPDRRVSFRAYDGSSVGPQDNDVILEIRSPRAVQFLAGAPSQLGLARAYVSGDLEIIGDAYTALSRLFPLDTSHLSWRDKLELAKTFGPQALKRPAPPPQERRLRGRRHSKGRDAEAIHHHYQGIHGRGVPRCRRLPRGSAGGEVRPRLPQTRTPSGDAPA